MSGIIPENGDHIENPDPEADAGLPRQQEQEDAEVENEQSESESSAGQVRAEEDDNARLSQQHELAEAEGQDFDVRANDASSRNAGNSGNMHILPEPEAAEDEIEAVDLNPGATAAAGIVKDQNFVNETVEEEAAEDEITERMSSVSQNENIAERENAEDEYSEGSDNEDDLETLKNNYLDNVIPEIVFGGAGLHTGEGFGESTQAEAEQDLSGRNSECTGAEYSLEPEDSVNTLGTEEGAVGGQEEPDDEVESQRLELPVETHRTESDSQLSLNDHEEIFIHSGAHSNDYIDSHTIEPLKFIGNFGAASDVSDNDEAWETNSLPEEEDYGPERDRCLFVGNSTETEPLETEADQELELTGGAAASGFVDRRNIPNIQDFSDVSCPECVESPAHNSSHVNDKTVDKETVNDCHSSGCDQGAASMEDEISTENMCQKPKSNSESYEPECDQSLIVTGLENESSQSVSEVVTVDENGSTEQGSSDSTGNLSEANQSVETEDIHENIVINCVSDKQDTEFIESGQDGRKDLTAVSDKSGETDSAVVRTKDNVQTESVIADSVNRTRETDHSVHEDSEGKLLEENPSSKCNSDSDLKTDTRSISADAHGAIPKSKPFQTYTESDSKPGRKNSTDSVKNTSKEESSGIDSEDELLSELDATLKSNEDKTSLNCAISDKGESDRSLSCDQCARNNLKCSLRNGLVYSDDSNIPDLKNLKRQLHQAKQLLLERECEISRLKTEVEEKTVRYETVILERDSYQKEIDCLKHQNTDDLYLPQIKELEYTIAQQQTEIRGLKDKLSSHDSAAKKAIAALQNEMKIRVEQVSKNCEEATKEKDAMVVKYAQAEHKNLEYLKQVERLEMKLREVEKEKEGFMGKFKAVKEHRTKIGAELEAKIAELHNVHKEQDKLREQLSSADTRVKWAQNKLKAELEAHKETKAQLEKANVKIREAKEETQQIRKDCQAMIKTYQESEEVKSNSLDKELKIKESELLAHQQQQNHTELEHVKTLRELEQLKAQLAELKKERSGLKEKITKLETEHDQSQMTVNKYSEIIQRQKKEIAELRERIESLVHVKSDFTRAQELIKVLDAEISDLKVSNKDLVSDMEACRRRETDKMEVNAKLSRKNAELQSENTTLSNKVFSLTSDLQSCKMEYQDVESKLKDISDALANEKKKREEETQSLNTKLAGKCKAVEDLMRKVEEEKDEIKTLKRKHTNNVKDLTRQLQQVRRKLENYEVTSNGDKDTVSLGSRTSSNGSLNTVGLPEQSNSSGSITNPSVTVHSQPVQQARQPSPEQEYPLITEQVEVNKQVLIERIVKLQRTMARKNEKIEFMDDHISQLVDEIQKKNRIIQNYILREEAGTMTTESVDHMKAELARKHSIMGSLYSSHLTDGTMTLDLSLEINRKLQAVLEDTLLKNMTLKESLDTLGQEIARLSQENRNLQLKIQGKHTTRTRPR